MTIKSISFDLDDTFWPVMPTILKAEEITNQWIKKNYPGTAKLLGSKDVIEVRDLLIKKNPNLLNQISDLRKGMFFELSLRAGYSNDESTKMANQSFEIFYKARNNVVFYDDVIRTLNELQKEYSLGVITNGNADLKIIGIDHLFDFCFSAADLNAHKPDPIVFEAVINATGLNPEEICHVGDHPINDVKGSHDCGMRPVWFNEKRTEWPLPGLSIPEFSEWKNFKILLEKNF